MTEAAPRITSTSTTYRVERFMWPPSGFRLQTSGVGLRASGDATRERPEPGVRSPVLLLPSALVRGRRLIHVNHADVAVNRDVCAEWFRQRLHALKDSLRHRRRRHAG